MSTWRTTRQIEYITGMVIFIGVFVIAPLIYWQVDDPTCFDNVKNQNEIDIDCGGVCVRACRIEVAPPQIRWDRLFKIRDGEYSALAYIENSNLFHMAKNVPYTFKLFDKDQKVMAIRKGNINIEEGSRLAIFEPHFYFEEAPARIFFEFDKEIEWMRTAGKVNNITTSDPILENFSTVPRVRGLLSNLSLEKQRDVQVVAIVYGGKNNAIGVSGSTVEVLNGLENKPIYFTWPEVFPLSESVCRAPVDISILVDRSGSMKSDGIDPPQPLTDVKNAAKSFVGMLSGDGDQVSIVTFANDAPLIHDFALSADKSGAIQALDQISILTGTIQQTNIESGLSRAMESLSLTKNLSPKVIVLLTDGVPTLPSGATKDHPSVSAIKEAVKIKGQGVKIFTIGLGKNIDKELLRTIATIPEDSYIAPKTEDLVSIYKNIATKICKDSPVIVELIPMLR